MDPDEVTNAQILDAMRVMNGHLRAIRSAVNWLAVIAIAGVLVAVLFVFGLVTVSFEPTGF